ncbi:hypothetical protein GLYMA_20G088700v4 [Glycine max]|uniref:Uncharacterized protein n=2 Tax=Glycine subgen. Soja TaxID=1462606 RepID=K7N2E8_SOYBN|nr:hypothetical protein JHK87_055987 [Glycine soja]KAG4918447.1 hypothetical protein JHK85_056728 [Glycine max]KAH1035222.1 hypothetical protein GYH30_055283 [Glycine max]KRG90397.1 hypothetical protein GLYMA_20G088700v4 [Glycine max]RZB43022.1 hypothetical protein D0Y65_053578 [Glycine soja]
MHSCLWQIFLTNFVLLIAFEFVLRIVLNYDYTLCLHERVFPGWNFVSYDVLCCLEAE